MASPPLYLGLDGLTVPKPPAYASSLDPIEQMFDVGDGDATLPALGSNMPSGAAAPKPTVYTQFEAHAASQYTQFPASGLGAAGAAPRIPARHYEADAGVPPGGRGQAYSLPPALSVAAPPPAPAAPAAPIKPQNPFNALRAGPKGNVRDLRNLGATHDRESKAVGGTVRYLEAEGRRKYEVSMGAVILRALSGIALDTEDTYKHYKTMLSARNAGGRTGLGSAMWGTGRAGQTFQTLPEWRGTALIWVCAPDPETDSARFYTHVCKIHKFHHSSFAAGGGVIGAGEWIVQAGKLLYVSANSGHYRPDLQTFYHAVLHMSKAFNADTKVLMYDSTGDTWVHRPILDFISAPSGNGRYKTHPQA